ncbi:dihydrodipicolinate synthase family protein [Kaistia algarum]|uniref:dihydrodipicolinate synthase family protein n=1 Tax=Kaistia algarum TaxID=2083279 RepID=UPI000CE91D89|nr:dihydrodipicolinate synthase family protein [Kaistia algarum]MCX5516732.1 dihydrodipicolinate synthase family protein [Kaistia algarum]PPE78625.1 dihydrodipicolinate synthase family protein [Kaistia algarum]
MAQGAGTATFGGIHAILYAFFDAEETLDRAAMRRQVELCIGSGVAGIVALGLATEVAKLTLAERLQTMRWVAEDVAGRVPVGFTIFGTSVREQLEQVKFAEAQGADWVILQPPVVGNFAASEYIDFFSRVAKETSLPVAIQNAPAYLGRGLSGDDLRQLTQASPNIRVVKGESSAVDIAGLIATTRNELPILNGRGGLELLDNLRAGCAGFILAPDVIDYAVRAYSAFRAGDEAEAAAAYGQMLPAVVFVMQSIETLISHGKRLFAERAGLVVHDRAPALRPTEFSRQLIRQYATALQPFGSSATNT